MKYDTGTRNGRVHVKLLLVNGRARLSRVVCICTIRLPPFAPQAAAHLLKSVFQPWFLLLYVVFLPVDRLDIVPDTCIAQYHLDLLAVAQILDVADDLAQLDSLFRIVGVGVTRARGRRRGDANRALLLINHQ